MMTPWGFLQMLLRGSGSGETVTRLVERLDVVVSDDPCIVEEDSGAISVVVVPDITITSATGGATEETETAGPVTVTE